MMGYNHAISGAAAWTAVATTAVGFGFIEVTPAGLIAGAIVCAGAALLPDADHPSATIAHSAPGGSVITGALGKLSGGHRHGMHSLLAVVATFVLAWAVSLVTWKPDWWAQPIFIGCAIATMAMTAFATKVLKMAKSWFQAWVIGFAVAAAITMFMPSEKWWFPVAVTLGYGVHLLGDYLTVAGIAWMWPWKPPAPVETPFWGKNGYFALPVLGNAGSAREYVLGFAMAIYTLVGIGMQLYVSVGAS